MENEQLLAQLLDVVAEKDRPRLRARITTEAQETAPDDPAGQARFLKDLDILINFHGPQFVYSRGIAQGFHVGDAILDLASDIRSCAV